MIAEPSARERKLAAAEDEQTDLRKNATFANFATQFGLAAGCWAIVFLVAMYDKKSGGNLGFLFLPILLVFVPAILGAFFFSYIFSYDWLAIATLATPKPHRLITHLLGAIVLACLYTFVEGDPLSALRKTYIYLGYHGFFAIKLMLVGAVVAAFAYTIAWESELLDFPRYPLRWYGLLTIGSILVGDWICPADDTSSKFHWYADTAHYTGTVIVTFLAFYFGARSGNRGRSNAT